MRNIARAGIGALMVLLFAWAPCQAWADFDAGQRSLEKGDIPAALNEWLKAADQADPRAQYRLGLLYEEGTLVSQDYDLALRWYVSAAEQGYADAEYRLGLMYYYGQGAERDNIEAVRWLRLAAGHGNADAQLLVALIERACDFL